jgi:transposase-like protein
MIQSLPRKSVRPAPKVKMKRVIKVAEETSDRWVRDTYQRVVSNWCQTLRAVNKRG